MTKPEWSDQVGDVPNTAAKKKGSVGSWIPANKNKKNNKIKGVIDFIKDNTSAPSVGTLVEQVEKRRHLQACVYEGLEMLGLGNLADGIEPGAISAQGDLKLQVSHSAVAAKLQQRMPSLMRFLQGSGWPIQSLSIKVSPTITPPGAFKPTPVAQVKTPLTMSDSGKRAWLVMARSIDKDSKIFDAVQKLLNQVSKNKP